MSAPQNPQDPRGFQSPWSPPPPPKPPANPAGRVYRPPLDRRQWAWLLIVLVAVGAGIWAMTELMPDRAQFNGDWPAVAQWAMLATIMGAGLVRLRMKPHEAVRNILLWLAIAAALGFGYTVWMQMQAPPHAGPPPVHVIKPSLPGGQTQQAQLLTPATARRL